MSFATRSCAGQNGRWRKQIAHNIKPNIIMRNSNLITVLVAGGIALATTNLRGQDTEQQFPAKNPLLVGQPGQYPKQVEPAATFSGAQNLKASSIIGLAVCNESGEHLGKVQDLIVSMASHSVPFAIVEYGGALGIGVTHVAVPLPDLKWSSESKQLILMTTKEQFESASTTPTGEWAGVASDDCLKNVDRFYGQPSIISESRYERQEATGIGEGREPVRTPKEQKGATRLMNPQTDPNPGATPNAAKLTDDYVVEKVNGVIHKNLGAHADQIQVTVKNGRVILKGSAASAAQKQLIESQIKAVPGVDQVEDQLQTTPE